MSTNNERLNTRIDKHRYLAMRSLAYTLAAAAFVVAIGCLEHSITDLTRLLFG